ncbi:DNA polymerase alpha subunit B [Osmia bicornis bicornis]|uniref:DNA polymerase alpha subunit B n=1 Tax=Osmia bicornis bicornis TaxID=1437191 RepID=UPI001EAF828F|nr:DNA polymerase alpha subunit B [Osmia bicornis bicornis]
MVSEESLISCFCNLGCNVPHKSVIERCLQLCRAHNMDEETFVELWVAYAVPHSLDIDPTIDNLNKMEEEELKIKTKEDMCNATTSTISCPQVDDKTSQEISDNILDMYIIGESSTLKQNKRIRSPTAVNENDNKIRAVDQIFTPSTYTTNVTVPNRAPSSTVSGKVLLYFGPRVKSWRKQIEQDVSIVKADNPHVPKDVVYMYEMLSKQGSALTSNCESFGERLCHVWDAKMGPTKPNVRYVRNVSSISQAPFRTWGRIFIVFDKSIGSKIVMLEGCKRSKGNNNAPIVRLDLSGIKHYSVFPGQILAVEGINIGGNALVAKELFVKGHAVIADVPKLLKDLRIYVAVGPFTPSDNLNYQPLWDLMEHVVEEEPDILILVGPFIEYTHPEIKKCTLRDTYQDFFDKILGKIVRYLQGKSTRVILVSSNRDAHHDTVYPTPEFTINTNKIGSNVTNIYSMPDPCIISVEGLEIGITSVDVLRQLGQQEVSNTSGMDRVGRLADHVLSQASFYPLYPPSIGLNLDTTLWKKYACFERQPHIMILPSDIKYYCKPLNESVVLNPERLQKYTYAKLYVRAVNNGKWNPNNVSCEIVKV